MTIIKEREKKEKDAEKERIYTRGGEASGLTSASLRLQNLEYRTEESLIDRNREPSYVDIRREKISRTNF